MRLTSLLLSLFTLQAVTASSKKLRGNPQGNEEANQLASDNVARMLTTTTSHIIADEVSTRSTITTYKFTTKQHKISYLCWPGNTQVDAITKYQGRLCSDGYTIIWDSMKTVANKDSDEPIIGKNGQKCEWSRSFDAAWNAEWLGSGCGDSPNSMPLARNNDEQVSSYWDFRAHKDPKLCWNDGSSSNAIVRYDSKMCPNDRNKVIWNSMMTIDSKGNAVTCSDGKKAVWSRHDYNPTRDAQFIREYFGDCGIAPTKFPTLRTAV